MFQLYVSYVKAYMRMLDDYAHAMQVKLSKPNTQGVIIHQFLGLAGYYWCFIPEFSKIAQLMTKLLQKDVKFVWSLACEEAFQP